MTSRKGNRPLRIMQEAAQGMDLAVTDAIRLASLTCGPGACWECPESQAALGTGSGPRRRGCAADRPECGTVCYVAVG